MEDTVLDKLNAFLKRKGMRRTPQRELIVRAAFRDHEHFTAEDLLERAQTSDPNTARATVYRTISLLVEAGLLREVDLGAGEKTYDPNFLESPNHNHLICIDCGRVTEFEEANIEVLHDCITRRLGFRPIRHSLRIEACCDQLRTTGRCEHLLKARLDARKIRSRRR